MFNPILGPQIFLKFERWEEEVPKFAPNFSKKKKKKIV